MKFGKQIQKRQLDLPEYAAHFLNYKALKKLIKQLSATPTIPAQTAADEAQEVVDPQTALRANKEVFFFKLEREIEKVNVFYLQKEAEFALRLKTLLDKKRVIQSRTSTTSKVSATFVTLLEGFQQFDSDLNKLQQFVEVNETAISKILKKWDKTSKSRTKELYLHRAVEVQPCFNRDVLRDLSDRSTTARLELEAWAEGENIAYDATRNGDHTLAGQSIGTQENDSDLQLLQATTLANLPTLREWITRLKSAPDARDRFTRAFLSAIPESPQEALSILLDTGLVDLNAEDDVNERNCLHEAAISGRMYVLETGISRGVDVARLDAYGRIPLHYACLHGRVEMVRMLVEAGSETVDMMDHDNFTPLIHSIVRHQLECVEQVLSHNARIDPVKESDHVPLNLACQHGSVPIATLLLERRAKLLPDAEGLFPQHLLARSGHSPDLLLLLKKYGADLNQKDRLYQWTPLFHAASEGRVACLRTLLENGVDVDAQDEKGLSAMYYATWEGHLECMRLLWSRTGSSGLLGRRRSAQLELAQTSRLEQFVKSSEPSSTIQPKPPESQAESMQLDGDAIPDLTLPPPIIPLRRYGHNFLDTKTFVNISFEESGPDAIQFYHDGKYPAARLTISSKLSDLIPRNVILPIQDDFRNISFQIDNLDSFAVDFEIFPTFGSKVISKCVALPDVFRAISSSSGNSCLPLFDPRLRAIGQINFNFQVIKPFQGNPLEITHFATYWKATSALDHQPSGFITGSSLSGDYVQLFVQLTRDGIPILWPRYTIDHQGIEFPVGRLTFHQFKKIGSDSYGSDRINLSKYQDADIAQMHVILHRAFLSLQEALAHLPTRIHVNLSVLYPSAAEEQHLGIGPTLNINLFADAILRDVFDHARATREKNIDFMRSVVFTSYNPQICTALNWKQPNYPVLLCNDLGETRDQKSSTSPLHNTMQSSGRSSISIKEAARIAQGNNFMGLICRSTLLDMVPALIESIKELGLVLVADTSDESDMLAVPGQGMGVGQTSQGMYRMPDGVDGTLRGDGVLRFNESIDM